MDYKNVLVSKKVIKQIEKLPKHVQSKLKFWVANVELSGILELRKHRGFNDKPLSGNRTNQRSIRLSKSYRAFYIERDHGVIELSYIEVIEVNNHEY